MIKMPAISVFKNGKKRRARQERRTPSNRSTGPPTAALERQRRKPTPAVHAAPDGKDRQL
jgi:hypothetical protein